MRDHNGQQLAYVYLEDEPGRRSAVKLLTRDEAGEAGVTVFDYVAIGVLIVLIVWAAADWVPRGKL